MYVCMQLQKRIFGFLLNWGNVETALALPIHCISFLKTVVHTLGEVAFRLPTLFSVFVSEKPGRHVNVIWKRWMWLLQIHRIKTTDNVLRS